VPRKATRNPNRDGLLEDALYTCWLITNYQTFELKKTSGNAYIYVAGQ